MEVQEILAGLNGNISPAAQDNVQEWLEQPKYRSMRDELIAFLDTKDYKAIEDAFFTVIPFGTGGRRGMTGVGSNRINRITVGESTQALCEYIKEQDESAPAAGIVIAYDTRLTSKELSRYSAQVAAASGFKVFLFEDFRSTPELSYAVRLLKAAAGIVITASHNPPSDNGFKAYWNDGAQVVAPHDTGILAKAAEITEIHAQDFDDAVKSGAIQLIGEEVDHAYLQAVVDQSECDDRGLKIAYSPLHGTGQTNTLRVLERAGFKNILTVEEQMVPDGEFPTIPSRKPNPEDETANKMAVDLMLENDADIAITNDPDADRIGVVVNHKGEAVQLTGNQLAVLVAEYVLEQKTLRQDISAHDYIAKTIVTTDMLEAVATRYGVQTHGNLLIGFKYIGELIRNNEGTESNFILGGEESYGLLKGDYARDKDGAVGALMAAEYAAHLKRQDKTLVDRLFELYAEYGLYVETLENIQFPGADGFASMQSIMETLRNNPPTELGGHRVTRLLDYNTLIATDTQTGEEAAIPCIRGNVVALEFGDSRRRVTIRPSGTEPKLKLYIQWFEESAGRTPEELVSARDELLSSLEDFAGQMSEQFMDK